MKNDKRERTMKYQKIYDILHHHPEIHIHDHSGMPYYPLWIVAELPCNGLRVWITYDCRQYGISTANAELDCSTREYSESFRHFVFSRQRDLVEKLQQLISRGKDTGHAAA